MTVTDLRPQDWRGLADVPVAELADELYAAPRPCNAELFDVDGDLWFPIVSDCRLVRMMHARAFELCDMCPVRDVCLEYALRSPQGEPGIWGGTTECERAALRAARDGGGDASHVRGCSGRRLNRRAEVEGRAA